MIQTPRLLIREFSEDDLPSLYSVVSISQVMKYSDGTEALPDVRKRLKKYRASYFDRGFGKWAVEFKDERRIIGDCGFGEEKFDGRMDVELGFRFLPEYWGFGVATEAAKACSEFGFQKYRFERFIAFAHPENIASWKVLEKVGMTYSRSRTFHDYPVFIYEKRCESNRSEGPTPRSCRLYP